MKFRPFAAKCMNLNKRRIMQISGPIGNQSFNKSAFCVKTALESRAKALFVAMRPWMRLVIHLGQALKVQ